MSTSILDEENDDNTSEVDEDEETDSNSSEVDEEGMEMITNNLEDDFRDPVTLLSVSRGGVLPVPELFLPPCTPYLLGLE